MKVNAARPLSQPSRPAQARPAAQASQAAQAAPVGAALAKPTGPSVGTRLGRAGIGALLGGSISAAVGLGGLLALNLLGAPVGFVAGMLGFAGIGLAGIVGGGLYGALRPNTPSEGAKKDFDASPRASQIKSLLDAGKGDEAVEVAQTTSEAIYVADKLREGRKDYSPALQRALELAKTPEDTLAVASGLKDGVKAFRSTLKYTYGEPYQAPDYDLFPKAYAKLQDQLKDAPDQEAEYQFKRQMAEIPTEWYPQLDSSVQQLARKLDLYFS